MYQPSFLKPLLLAILAVPVFPAAASNIVDNPGFESGDLTGWTSNAPAFGVGVDNNSGDVHSGNFGVYFGTDPSNPTLDSFLSQTLNTSVGEKYTLSFWMSDYQADALGGHFNVNLGGSQLFNLTDVAQQDFTLYSATYTATSASTLLQFDANNVPGWFGLDDVSVTANQVTSVPEPSTWIILLTGMAFLACLPKRRALVW